MRYHLPRRYSRRVLVVGAGVIGLTTALVARRRGFEVTIVADRFAPHVTSVVAGALWEWPPAVCGQHRDHQSLGRSKEWSALSYRIFNDLSADPLTGVHMRPAVFYHRTPVDDDLAALAKMTELRSHVRGFRHDATLIAVHGVSGIAVDAYEHLAPMIDTDRYMAWLLREVRSAGCEVEVALIRGNLVEEQTRLLRRYDASSIVNCSGLGSIELGGDTEMRPLRGAVVHARNPGVTSAHCLAYNEDLNGQNMVFIVPRGRDRLVLGGIVEPDEWTTDLTLKSRQVVEMVGRCRDFLPALRDVQLAPGNPLRTGLRPYRQSNVRLETSPGSAVVHNTGHGGSGFTFSWGCAEDAVDLVEKLG